MREIKFRAWLEGTHGNLTFSEPTMGYNVTLSQEGFWCDVEGGWDMKGAYSTIPIMQFTGLLDNNGTPIYEGDIVLVDSSFVPGSFEDGVYRVTYMLPDCAFVLERLYGEYGIGFNECYVYEVIGNIHENPELLYQNI